jgi:hypothetical protein
VYWDPTGHATATLPNGKTVNCTIKDGVTLMPDGSRPPVGAVVHADNGKDYQMTEQGKGVEVPKGSTGVAVSTTSGTQAGLLNNGSTTMTVSGSRPANGSVVHTPQGGDYRVENGVGVKVNPVTVTDTEKKTTTTGYASNGYTTMLDGSRPSEGSILQTQQGGTYKIVNGTGVKIDDKGTSSATSSSSTPPKNSSSFDVKIDPNLTQYNRTAAAAYGIEWGENHNPAYVNFSSWDWVLLTAIKSFFTRSSSDCGNFVSQALHAGGVSMTDEWYFKYVPEKVPGTVGVGSSAYYERPEWSPAWAAVSNQYEYFTDPKNGYSNSSAIVKTPADVSKAVKNGSVELGDLLYWFADGHERPHHAGIVSGIVNGEIHYAAHTKNHRYQPLSEVLGDERISIVHINDFIPRGVVR